MFDDKIGYDMINIQGVVMIFGFYDDNDDLCLWCEFTKTTFFKKIFPDGKLFIMGICQFPMVMLMMMMIMFMMMIMIIIMMIIMILITCWS